MIPIICICIYVYVCIIYMCIYKYSWICKYNLVYPHKDDAFEISLDAGWFLKEMTSVNDIAETGPGPNPVLVCSSSGTSARAESHPSHSLNLGPLL